MCCWPNATRPAWRPAPRMPAACTCNCCPTTSPTKRRRTAARPRTRCRSRRARIALWKEIAAEAGEDLGIRTEGGLMLAEDAAGHGLAAPQIGDGAALGHREPRARRQRTAHARPRAVRTHGRRRLRPGRGLRRPAARHDGGAEAGAACRRARAARRRGAGDRARRRRMARANDQGPDHRRTRGERHRPMGGAHRQDGGPRPAGHRHGAAGHRHRAGAADDEAPDRASPTGICR